MSVYLSLDVEMCQRFVFSLIITVWSSSSHCAATTALNCVRVFESVSLQIGAHALVYNKIMKRSRTKKKTLTLADSL
jgi:hypothetical protein